MSSKLLLKSRRIAAACFSAIVTLRTMRAVCAAALAVASASAQDAPHTVKLDLDVGLGRTAGGKPRDVPVAFGFGVVAAASLHAATNRGPVVGAGAQAHWPLDYGTSCILPPGAAQCIPAYPKFTLLSLLAGWEAGRQRKVGGSRVLFGPTVFRTDEPRTLFGLQGRLDVSVLQVQHFGLKLWTLGATASPFRGGRYLMLSGGLGARLQ